MSGFSIGARLLSVAKFVRQGASFADIGTDHAYLPVFLIKTGVIDSAIASDINEGPLENARRTAAEHGVGDRITFILTDGARELEKFKPTDLSVCGMGGELIARIIEDAPYLKARGVRLILQPMTRQEQLREYLFENGFSIVAESYSTELGKSYLVLAVEYSGAVPEDDIRRVRYGVGDTDNPSAWRAYLTAKLKSKRAAYLGITSGGGDGSELLADIEYLDELLSKACEK